MKLYEAIQACEQKLAIYAIAKIDGKDRVITGKQIDRLWHYKKAWHFLIWISELYLYYCVEIEEAFLTEKEAKEELAKKLIQEANKLLETK